MQLQEAVVLEKTLLVYSAIQEIRLSWSQEKAAFLQNLQKDSAKERRWKNIFVMGKHIRHFFIKNEVF